MGRGVPAHVHAAAILSALLEARPAGLTLVQLMAATERTRAQDDARAATSDPPGTSPPLRTRHSAGEFEQLVAPSGQTPVELAPEARRFRERFPPDSIRQQTHPHGLRLGHAHLGRSTGSDEGRAALMSGEPQVSDPVRDTLRDRKKRNRLKWGPPRGYGGCSATLRRRPLPISSSPRLRGCHPGPAGHGAGRNPGRHWSPQLPPALPNGLRRLRVHDGGLPVLRRPLCLLLPEGTACRRLPDPEVGGLGAVAGGELLELPSPAGRG